MRIVVVGAGAFGGWTALALCRRGVQVTLIDAWGPGHARASSGGESRVIRAAYGSRSIYTKMTLRALDLWRAHDPRRRLLHETGVLWLFGDDDGFGHASARVLRDHGARLDVLPLAEASRRFPQVAFDGVRSVFWEPEAGYLLARRACEDVVARLTEEGGEYRQSAAARAAGHGRQRARPAAARGRDVARGRCVRVGLRAVAAAAVPRRRRGSVTTSRQEVLYFGTAPGDARFTVRELPVWMDFAAGSRAGQVYGVPASGSSGFKVADDTPGPPIDPGSGERIVSPEGVAKARAFLSRRFPGLADAPLVAAEVCQVPRTRPTPTSSSIAIRGRPTSGSWAAAPATASRWGPPLAR